MKINMPIGSSINTMEKVLRSHGVELAWVMPAEGQIHGADDVEWVEMPDDNELESGTIVDSTKGEFLALERFYSRSYNDDSGQNVLVHRVLRRITPKEFYSLLGRKNSGSCTAGKISDHLEQAFNQGMAGSLGLESALFAYLPCDGGIVHQHSA